jgi:hypothetical protein
MAGAFMKGTMIGRGSAGGRAIGQSSAATASSCSWSGGSLRASVRGQAMRRAQAGAVSPTTALRRIIGPAAHRRGVA